MPNSIKYVIPDVCPIVLKTIEKPFVAIFFKGYIWGEGGGSP